MGHDRSVARRAPEIPQFPILVCRNATLERASGTPASRLMGNCAALAFGMDERHVDRNFQLRLVAPAALRRGLRVQWSVLPEQTVAVNGTIILVAILTDPTGTPGIIARPGKIVMEIQPRSVITAGRDPIVKDNQTYRDRPTQVNRGWRLQMLRLMFLQTKNGVRLSDRCGRNRTTGLRL
jgi:hypothetical protein